MARSECKHLEMMRHPERWPQPFILPLNHRHRKDPELPACNLLGFLLEEPGKQQAAPRVYVGCMYFSIMGKTLADLPVEDYPSLEAVVLAGWEVN